MSDVHINFTFSDPETAAAFAANFSQGAATLLSMLDGSGTAAQNHRKRAATAPKAVADAPDGETAADYRKRYVAWQSRNGGQVLTNPETKKDFPMRGALSPYWRDALREVLAAEVKKSGAIDDTSEMVDGAVIEDDEAAVETPTAESETVATRRRQFGKGRKVNA